MNVAIAAVISVDGKLTRHGEPNIESWASKEDHTHFTKLIAVSDAIVIGSHVYEAMRGLLKLEPGKLRVVLTTRTEEYREMAVPGQLEFVNRDLKQLIHDLDRKGKQNVLIAGGTRIITDSLKYNLADTLYLTIEPRIFGDGTTLAEGMLDKQLRLVSNQQLNQTGTTLLIYEILKKQS